MLRRWHGQGRHCGEVDEALCGLATAVGCRLALAKDEARGGLSLTSGRQADEALCGTSGVPVDVPTAASVQGRLCGKWKPDEALREVEAGRGRRSQTWFCRTAEPRQGGLATAVGFNLGGATVTCTMATIRRRLGRPWRIPRACRQPWHPAQVVDPAELNCKLSYLAAGGVDAASLPVYVAHLEPRGRQREGDRQARQ